MIPGFIEVILGKYAGTGKLIPTPVLINIGAIVEIGADGERTIIHVSTDDNLSVCETYEQVKALIAKALGLSATGVIS